MYVYMQLHVEATADASAPTYFLRQGLSSNLKLSNLVGMRLEIPLIFLTLHPKQWNYGWVPSPTTSGFYMDTKDHESGPPACVANNLPMETIPPLN